jgi:excisionase family DNA binding protein
MNNPDPRLVRLFSLLRTAINLLEDMTMHPIAPPLQREVSRPTTSPPRPITFAYDKIAYSIKEIRQLTGLSNGKIYLEIKKGNLRSSKSGGRTLILAEHLRAWIDSWSSKRN